MYFTDTLEHFPGNNQNISLSSYLSWCEEDWTQIPVFSVKYYTTKPRSTTWLWVVWSIYTTVCRLVRRLHMGNIIQRSPLNNPFKDATYVSLYPDNRSQILQYVKYTKKIISTKGIAKMWQIMCFWTKGKNTTTTKQNKISNIKNICISRKLNTGPFAPKADALLLHHRVNWEYRLKSSYLTILTQWIETWINSRICGPHIFNTFIFSVIC